MIQSAKFLITSTFIAISGLLPSAGTITAAYLPHGPANPTNPTWGQTSYRDIPWWFHDDNSVWGTGTPGAADAYDVSAVWAARLNRNNSAPGNANYEAAIINTPNYSHLGTNPYGAGGGAFGTQSNVTWGNGTKWNFTLEYKWSNGVPTASWTLQNGTATPITTGNTPLGSRVIDFVEGNVARPLTSTGATNPYREPHVLSDLLLRFGTVDSGTGATMNSVTVGNIALSVDGGAAESVNYQDLDGNLQHSLTTRWDYVAGGDSATNPRKIEFLLLDDVLPGHTKDFSLTGELTFAWTGNASSISGSGLIFEAKMGDLDFFSGAHSFAVIPNSSSFDLIPEPSGTLLLGIGFLTCLRRKR